MKCPACGKEMEEGILKEMHYVSWSSGRPDPREIRATLARGGIGALRLPETRLVFPVPEELGPVPVEAPASRCRSCGLYLFQGPAADE